MSVTFVMKHKSGGKFIHPQGGSEKPGDNTDLVVHQDLHERMHFQFDIVEDVWGYIRHKASGKIVHPKGGDLHPGNNTKLVLHHDRHSAALFALDDVRNYIVHKGGRYAHPKGGDANPGNNTKVVLHDQQHDAMKWLFVSPKDTSEQVYVYGKPTVAGKWKMINAILDPKAEHTYTLSYTLGKSATESTTSSIEFKWETSAGAAGEFLSFSTSTSLTEKIEKSSSSTWSEEITATRQIKVDPGKSVVTWQFVFTGSQCSHKAAFQSNILADTDSTEVEPDK